MVRLAHLVLGFVLVLQAGPLCACALGHYIACDDSHGITPASLGGRAPAPPAGCFGDPGCDACFPTSTHPHGTTCQVRDPSEAGSRPTLDPSPLPAALLVRAVTADACVAGASRTPASSPPDIPPGATRSLPLLI